MTVSAGGGYTCGVTTDGAAYCWGYNGDGELGNGTTTGPEQCGPSGGTVACSSTPVAVAGGYAFVTVSAGDGQTCGVTTGGAAYCWGYNGSGELGTGSTTSSATPAAVVGGHTFSMVSATGLEHTCGVTADGAAYCWGDNFWGELGTGTTTSSSTPVPVLGGHTFATVSTGGYYIDIVETGSAHTCGVTTGGIVYCWGSGALGNGTWSSTVPVKVAGQP
jgi:alpha-tubulin suppressor-like RCC1 family protein